MIERYSRPEMAGIWSEEGKYRRWLDVEIAVCEVHAENGVIPADALAEIREKAAVDPARVAEIEDVVRHDVIAFLTNVAENVGPASRYVHYGMTSSDVLDTALALQIRDAGELLLAGVDRLIAALETRAVEFKHTPCVGRTHGIHAEPTTFGLKLLVYRNEMVRNRKRLVAALADAAVGKISGARSREPSAPLPIWRPTSKRRSANACRSASNPPRPRWCNAIGMRLSCPCLR